MPRPHGASVVFSRRFLEGITVLKETNPTTDAGSKQILGADPERVQLTIYNLSASEVYAGFSADVGSNNGMLIPPAGGFLNMNVRDDFDMVIHPVYIYSAAAGNQLYVVSNRREVKLERED